MALPEGGRAPPRSSCASATAASSVPDRARGGSRADDRVAGGPARRIRVGGVTEASFDRDWQSALDAVAARDWCKAVALLKGVAARDRNNAEVHNQLGFAYRQANDLDNAFVHYREALRLSPKHLGAHEYIGEAYLMRGDVAMARTHLRRLEQLCGRDCDEYKDLARAIDQAQ